MAEKDAKLEKIRVEVSAKDAFCDSLLIEKQELLGQIQAWTNQAEARKEELRRLNTRLNTVDRQHGETKKQLDMQVRFSKSDHEERATFPSNGSNSILICFLLLVGHRSGQHEDVP